MPAAKRVRTPATDKWDDLQLRLRWPEQVEYELIRPVVFGRTPAERAEQTGAAARTIARRTGFAGRFALTPLTEPLRSNAGGAVRETLLQIGRQTYRRWGDLLYSVQTGAPAFEHVFGMTNWEYRIQTSAIAVFSSLIGSTSS